MAGEQLATAELSRLGVEGDRILQVKKGTDRVMTARTRPLLLRHHAKLNDSGEVLVGERAWDSAEVAASVTAAAGEGTHLVRSDPEQRFDILPLLIVTDGALEAVGYDNRRFRPNLVIGGVPGLTEREWEGGQLRIGPVLIGMEDLRGRCIMTTFDPDSGAQDLNVLRRVQKEFGGVLGLNSFVRVPGRVSVGDLVEFQPRK